MKISYVKLNAYKYRCAKNVMNFNFEIFEIDGNDNGNVNEKDKDSKNKDDIIKEAKDLLLYRNLFYLHHNLNERITTNNYVFTDELSLKYNLLIPNYNIYNLSKISSNYVKTSIYTKWHMLMSIKLFGIPNDKIGCKKCSFFLTKFMSQMNTSIYIKDFIENFKKYEDKASSEVKNAGPTINYDIKI